MSVFEIRVMILFSASLLSLFYYILESIFLTGVGSVSPVLIMLFVFFAFACFLHGAFKGIYIRYHFFVFFAFFSWLMLKVATDVGDFIYLRELAIGTTGGVFLYLALGLLVAVVFDVAGQNVSKEVQRKVYFLVNVVVFLSVVNLLYLFIPRVRDDLFYLSDVAGDYQRSGNFLSILCLVNSYCFLRFYSHVVPECRKGALGRYSLVVVNFSTVLVLLIVSQLIGSNSATAVVMIVLFCTFFTLYLRHINVVPAYTIFSVSNLGYFAIFSILALVVLVACLAIVSLVFPDLGHKVNLLGFGGGSISSIDSRLGILADNFMIQMGYAPLAGDMLVALKTTGQPGRYLHSFIPYIFSHLGVIGVGLILAMLFACFISLYNESVSGRYGRSFLANFSFYTMLSLFVFANMSVSVSWPVFWFALGMLVPPIVLRDCVSHESSE